MNDKPGTASQDSPPPGKSNFGFFARIGIVSLCLLFAVSALSELLSGRLDNLQTYGVRSSEELVLPDGSWTARYILPTGIDHLDDIALFVAENSRIDNQGQLLKLEVLGTETETRSVVLGEPNPNFREYSGSESDPAALVFYHLDTSRSENPGSSISIRVSMEHATGFALVVQPRHLPDHGEQLLVDDKLIANVDLGIQTREVNSRRLWRMFLLGTTLVLVTIAVMWDQRILPLPVLLAAFPMALILAEICWQHRLDGYWNYFWPDGYTELAHQARLWLTGDSSWAQLGGYLSSFRNGQSWLVPLGVAMLAATGMSYLLAFTLLNYLFYLLTVLAWTGLFKRAFPWTTPLRLSLFLLLMHFHYLHVLAGGTPMTDIGAAAMVALFFYAFFPLLEQSTRRSAVPVLMCGIVIAFACQTRVALLPLLLTPLATSIFLILIHRYLPSTANGRTLEIRHYARIAAPTFVAALVLLGFYLLLNLFGTFRLAQQVATSELFQQAFSADDFVSFTANVCLPALVCTALLPARVLRSKIILALWIFIVGYLAMLYLGQIITWERYWIPIAGPATFVALAVLNLSDRNRLFLGGAVLILGMQFYLIFHDNLGWL